MERMAYCGPMGRFSAVELCSSLTVTFVLINAPMARSVSFGGRPSLVRFVVVLCSFHLKGIMKDLDIFFITQPWLARRAPWSSWCDASGLAVLQPLGPFRKGVFISTDHVTIRLHTGGLHFTNYVTFEGNWLHQNFHSTCQFSVFYFFFIYIFFSFHFTNLDYFVQIHHIKKYFKLQVGMEQNR